MCKLYSFLIVVLLANFISGQERIGFDINYRNNSYGATFSYHHVFYKNWIVSLSVTGGKKGFYQSEEYIPFLEDELGSNSIVSPWNEFNAPLDSEFGLLYLKDFRTYNYSLAAQVGIGYFHNFNVIHGIRAHFTGQFGYGISDVYNVYRNTEKPLYIHRKKAKYPIASLGLEAYHTIRVHQRFTVYYGLKIPYFFLIDKNQFNPKFKSYDFYGLMPEITLGITYAIGKCNQTSFE